MLTKLMLTFVAILYTNKLNVVDGVDLEAQFTEIAKLYGTYASYLQDQKSILNQVTINAYATSASYADCVNSIDPNCVANYLNTDSYPTPLNNSITICINNNYNNMVPIQQPLVDVVNSFASISTLLAYCVVNKEYCLQQYYGLIEDQFNATQSILNTIPFRGQSYYISNIMYCQTDTLALLESYASYLEENCNAKCQCC